MNPSTGDAMGATMRRSWTAGLAAAAVLAGCANAEDTEARIAELEAEVADAEDRAAEAEGRADDAEADRDAARDEVESLESDLEALEAEAETLAAEDDDGAVRPEVPAELGESIEREPLAVTAHSFERPPDPDESFLSLDSGQELAVADVEVCVAQGDGVGPIDGVGESGFRLVDDTGGRWEFWNVQDYARSPRFPTSETVQPGDCVRGWVTFEIPEDTEIDGIDADEWLSGGAPMEWTIE